MKSIHASVVPLFLLVTNALVLFPGLACAQAPAGLPYANADVPRPDLAPTEPIISASPSVHGFFSIVNPNDETISPAEAERIYLSACEVVERKFHRSDELRPRFKLILGANQNVLSFRNREIRLRQWDRYRFAEAVVELALNDLVPTEEKARLRDLAVAVAEATVNLCELRACVHQ